MSEARKQRRGIARLVADMATNATAIARKEVELARAEMTAKAQVVSTGAVIVAVGAYIAFLASLVLVAMLVLGVAEWVSPWLAALIVGATLATVSAVLAAVGITTIRRGAPAQPTESIEQAREDMEWLKAQSTSIGRSKS